MLGFLRHPQPTQDSFLVWKLSGFVLFKELIRVSITANEQCIKLPIFLTDEQVSDVISNGCLKAGLPRGFPAVSDAVR